MRVLVASPDRWNPYRAPRVVQCEGKLKFKTFSGAKQACPRDATPYRCPHCHGWHVGHAMTPQRRPRLPYVPEDGFED